MATKHQILLRRSEIFFVCTFQTLVLSLSAQNYEHQISVKHDNDLYFLTDQYYTAGTFVRYDKQLSQTPLEHRQWHMQLSQELYTPSTKTQPDSIFFDRPFAGILRLNAGMQYVLPKKAFFLELDYAMAGPQTKADDVHQAFHKLIDEQRPVWEYQLPDRHHLNISIESWHEFNTSLPFFTKMRFENKASLGTLENFFQSGIALDLKREGLLNNALSAGILNAKNPFVLSTGVYYRYQLFDARMEGHLINSKAIFTRSTIDHVLMVKACLKYQINNIRVQFWYEQQTKKRVSVDDHRYSGIQIGVLF